MPIRKSFILRSVTAFCTLALLAISSLSVQMPSMTQNIERDILPIDAKPTHYDLVIRPDLDAFVFSGSVNIR